MRDHYRERKGRDRTRDKSRDRSHERRQSSRDDKHRQHHSKSHHKRSRSRSTERRRERNRSQERKRKDGNRSQERKRKDDSSKNDRNQSRSQHDRNSKDDFKISPILMDDEEQEELEDPNAQSHQDHIQEEEPEEFEEEYQQNGHPSHSIPREEPEHIQQVEEQTAKGGMSEIRNMYREQNFSQNHQSNGNSNPSSKQTSNQPVNNQPNIEAIREKTDPSTKKQFIEVKREIIISKNKDHITRNQESNDPSSLREQIAKSKNETKQQKIISVESLRPTDSRNEPSRNSVDELLASIQRQKAETPRLEKMLKGPRIESIVTGSGERILVRQKVESKKIDLRTKINVSEDSSRSILNRIKKAL